MATEQCMSALEKANRVRLAGAAVKGEVRGGDLPAHEALYDQRAAHVEVLDLLCCQRRWGRRRAMRLLHELAMTTNPRVVIPENKRVGDLTSRQRGALARALDPAAEPEYGLGVAA